MKEKLENLGAVLQHVEDTADAYRKARAEGWDAVAAVLASGPVRFRLSERYEKEISEALAKIPEGLEREAMEAQGGPGYLSALEAESFEVRYGGGKVGLLHVLSMDDGIKAEVVDPFNGGRTTVGIDDIVGEVIPVIRFLQAFAD